ncbi:hypothetical protein BH11PSE11_BH11PSE11_32480 [soil metagenome]
MSITPSSENIVKEGTFIYDGCVECDVCIVFSLIRVGTGDYEDSPQIRDDAELDTYYLWFGSTTERGRYTAGGGGFASLSDAIANAESRPGFGSSIRWRT